MNEKQLISLEQTDISFWNFPALKEELAKMLDTYKNSVYTDDTIKTAKADRAKLNKVKEQIKSSQKAFKEKCLAPLAAIEPDIKELNSMLETQVKYIDMFVKDYEERQRSERKQRYKDFYNKKSGVLGKLAEPLFGKLLDPKWLNATSSEKKCCEELLEKINSAYKDICFLQELKSPFENTIIKEYTETLSVDEAKKHNDELIADNADAISSFEKSNNSEQKNILQESDHKECIRFLKISGKNKQIQLLFDFAKAIGVKIEEQQG